MTDVQIDGGGSIEIAVRVANNLPTTNLLLPHLLEISRSMPDNVNGLEANEAAELANKFLKGMDICAELYSLAISYELKTEAAKKQEFSKAMLVRAAEAGFKSAIDRKEYANGDEQCLEMSRRHIEAVMFRTLIEEKKQVFSKAHHLMKNILTREEQNSGEMYSAGGNGRNNGNGGSDNWVQRSNWVRD